MELMQLIMNSIIIGGIYSLVAASFSLIYATNKFLFFAHGASITFASYIFYSLFQFADINFIAACILTIILTAMFGAAIYYFICLPMQRRNSSNVIMLIANLALLVLFQNIFHLIFGSEMRSINFIKINAGLNIFGAYITALQIIIVIVSIIFLVLLYLFMKHTRLGRNMRAISDNKELASIVGINPEKIAAYSFLIGSGLAGVGGILIALEQNITPIMGTELMIKGFAGAIIGGINIVFAAVPGSYLLGFVENFGVWFLPSGYKSAIAFLLLFFFLLFKPAGIFGLHKGVKHD